MKRAQSLLEITLCLERTGSLLAIILCVVLALAGGRLWGAEASRPKDDPFAAMEKNFDEQARKMEKNFDAQTAALEKEWDRLEKEQNAAWEKMAREIENRWRDQVLSTEKVWVDYDPDLASRSRVDFDKGKITVEVLIPADEKDPKKAGKDKIAQKFEQIYKQKDEETSQSILAGQIQTSTGQTLSDAILDQFVHQDVVPHARLEPQPILSEDGQEHYKVSVNVAMVPEHLRIRAERYRGDVLENANRHGVPPELILAIIHTESSFNPRARSRAGAYGLMQLIPRHAARDSWLYLHPGEDRIIEPAYLLDPRNNIELGAAYLFLLSNQYMSDVGDPVKREYAVIAGYNWGPPMVRKRFVESYPVNSMPPQQAYERLKMVSPDETRDYLDRVTTRKKIYAPMFTTE